MGNEEIAELARARRLHRCAAMQDVRWLRLRDALLDRGWTSREDAMYAPHETMWFTQGSDDANITSFRNRISMAARASAAYVDVDVEHAALHEDLVSLAAALDEAIDGAARREVRGEDVLSN